MLCPGRALGPDELVVPARCGARGDSVGDPAAEAHLGAGTRGGSWVRERALSARVRWLLAGALGVLTGPRAGRLVGCGRVSVTGGAGCAAGKRTRG